MHLHKHYGCIDDDTIILSLLRSNVMAILTVAVDFYKPL